MPEIATLNEFRRISPPDAAVIDELTEGIRKVFGDALLGLYLYGSAVFGQFDPDVSDLDLTAILQCPVSSGELAALDAMHAGIVQRHPMWEARIEVQYIDADALQTFRTQRHQMANISPGEPLHIIETGIEWLMNWYLITHHGITITGADPRTLIPPIPDNEFVTSARDHAREWMGRWGDIDGSRSQSYAVLTLSRALYTHRTGQHVSKIDAVRWLASEYPEYRDLTDRAVAWRIASSFPSPETLPETRDFVHSIVDIIVSESPA